jgi:AGZA family xanthine/uracil permease-like MFS transporter
MESDVKSSSGSLLERLFLIRARGSTVGRELAGGLATFMTMSYIIFVNPSILANAGMSPSAVTAATCIGAAIPTLLMGLWANYPLALASGMGINAAVAFQATQPGMTWQTMMGVIVIEGIIITLLVLTGTREQVMTIIPNNLKQAIAVGIGMFIAFLGFQQMGWILKGPEGVLLTRGALQSKPIIVSTLGLLLMWWLLVRQVRGTILLGIFGTTLLAAIADAIPESIIPGPRLLSWPQAVFSLPDLSVFGGADLMGALKPALAGTIFAFLMTDFFDTMGTVIAVAKQGGFIDKEEKLPGLRRILMVDSLGAIWGGFCGASSTTSYIESAAGVSEGARTGLSCVVVSGLFLLALFFAPLFAIVPSVAVAPALVVVGFFMITLVQEIDFTSMEEGIAAFLVLLLIPFTMSISTGIGAGLITYVLLMALNGKGKSVHWVLYIISAIFVAEFVL